MPTMQEMANVLRNANPDNKPMSLQWMAERWWPDATWLKVRGCRHNGGPRVGARVAGGLAGRMERAGLLRLHISDGPRCYVLAEASNGRN